jgi:integrase
MNLSIDRLTAWHRKLATDGRKRKPDESAADARRRRQATANRILTILKAGLNFAEAQGKHAGPTPWQRVRPFRNVDATDQPWMTPAEATRFLNVCDPDFREIVRAALETGVRYGALCAMNVRDYDPANKQVAVRISKGGKRRFVPLTDSGNEFFSQLSVGRKGSQPMFVRDSGERWKPSQQNRRMHVAREIAEVSAPVTFKSLRTSYGSWQAQQGTPLQFIAVAMGHSDTRMTEKHYAHLVPSQVADTVRKNFPQFGPEQESNVERIRAG